MILPHGELLVIAFVVIAVVSAAYWPKLGAAIAESLVKRGSDDPPKDR
jgi:hypothetical protein